MRLCDIRYEADDGGGSLSTCGERAADKRIEAQADVGKAEIKPARNE
jgi:hypothetical protein